MRCRIRFSSLIDLDDRLQLNIPARHFASSVSDFQQAQHYTCKCEGSVPASEDNTANRSAESCDKGSNEEFRLPTIVPLSLLAQEILSMSVPSRGIASNILVTPNSLRFSLSSFVPEFLLSLK